MNKNDITKLAKQTIAIERNGLNALIEALDGELQNQFEKAVNLLAELQGRVIVSGVGKSGHIASKLAATMASTGTPAFFVHPAEANHGDLGMVARDDAILALSWSGETQELKGIITYSRRFKIPLIALTSNPNSTLATQADVVLALPKEQEACPHNLAPTTSTILQLAMGDTLAIALLEKRQFTANDFHKFHPGGKLGASLTRVNDVMHKDDKIPLVPLGTKMSDAIVTISEKGFGCVGIIDENGTLAGIMTDGDVGRAMNDQLLSMKVDEVMIKAPKVLERDAFALAAFELINTHNISAVIIVEDNKPIGIVHLHDLIKLGVA
jgi:arabinose-5-phosphate isomerase